MTEDIRTLSKWLNEESTAPIDRQALARVLAIAQQEPVLYVSAVQLEVFADKDDSQLGTHIPARKTAAGMFTKPLYAAPAPQTKDHP